MSSDRSRRGTGMVSKALLKEAAELLPRMPHTHDIQEVKTFIESNLRFNSNTTRKRYVKYITTYLFPEGVVDKEIIDFSRKVKSESIKNVCFYRFCEKYPLIYNIFKDLFLPNIGSGRVYRKQLDVFLEKRFPENNPGRFGGRGFVEALVGADVMRYDDGVLLYGYRKIDLPSFAFILFSEFPSPGMYDVGLVEKNRVFIPLLWRSDEMTDALYSLRNMDLISKVSMIDMMRQFTTKYSLKEIVEKLG